jgi:hypothetical protein
MAVREFTNDSAALIGPGAVPSCGDGLLVAETSFKITMRLLLPRAMSGAQGFHVCSQSRRRASSYIPIRAGAGGVGVCSVKGAIRREIKFSREIVRLESSHMLLSMLEMITAWFVACSRYPWPGAKPEALGTRAAREVSVRRQCVTSTMK